jgi:hypothetical protein
MENKKQKQDLDKFKKDYKNLAEKYSLPNFKEINEKFEIERLYEKETELLLREIRKFMAERISHYLRSVELFFNPGSAPLFFMKMLKNLKLEDKKKLEVIYEKLSHLEVDSFCLDVTIPYDEKKEADFLKKAYEEFDDIMGVLKQIMEKIKISLEEKSEYKGKTYFG